MPILAHNPLCRCYIRKLNCVEILVASGEQPPFSIVYLFYDVHVVDFYFIRPSCRLSLFFSFLARGLRLVILTKLWSMNFIGFPVVEIRLYFPLHCSLISVRKVFEQI